MPKTPQRRERAVFFDADFFPTVFLRAAFVADFFFAVFFRAGFFLPPPSCLLTVAHARFSAVFFETPWRS
jgi:hypothetical protein